MRHHGCRRIPTCRTACRDGPHRSNLTGEPYDDDEILNFLYNDITELQQDLREEVTFDSWLVEMISWGRFYPEENADAR
jgi:hypothetical protein